MESQDPRPPREAVLRLLERYGASVDPITDTVVVEVEELRAMLGVIAIGMFRTARKVLTDRVDGI